MIIIFAHFIVDKLLQVHPIIKTSCHAWQRWYNE